MPKQKGVPREVWVRQIDELREKGMSTMAACKQAGYHYATYYAAKREMGEGRSDRTSPDALHRLQEENSILWTLVRQLKGQKEN